MNPSEWIQLGSLLVGAVGLYFLVRYVAYTKQIAEATFKPAVIAVQGDHTEDSPHLRNIGNGPAMDVLWEIPGQARGEISCIEAKTSSDKLGFPGLKTFTNATLASGKESASIICHYKGISGAKFVSTNEFDADRWRFNTTFG